VHWLPYVVAAFTCAGIVRGFRRLGRVAGIVVLASVLGGGLAVLLLHGVGPFGALYELGAAVLGHSVWVAVAAAGSLLAAFVSGIGCSKTGY
jgi:hypothetical protein